MDKYVNVRTNFYMLVAAVVFSIFSTFKSCSTNSNVKDLEKKTKSLTVQVDSLDSSVSGTVSTDELRTILAIEGLRTSKRSLYDNNKVVRTKVRPDDVMNGYDKEIQILENSLK